MLTKLQLQNFRCFNNHIIPSNSNYAPTHSNCRDHSLKFLLSKRIASHNRIFDQTKYNPNQLIFQSNKQN